MRSKTMTIMAAAVLLLPTIAYAQPSEGRGLYHRDDLKTARDDVRAHRKFTSQAPPFGLSVKMIELSDCAPSVGAPGSLVGVPRDTTTPLVPNEIRNARTPHCDIAHDPELLQYLPRDFFKAQVGKAALERVARYEDLAGDKAALADRLLSLCRQYRLCQDGKWGTGR
jgi:hypothetical protein